MPVANIYPYLLSAYQSVVFLLLGSCQSHVQNQSNSYLFSSSLLPIVKERTMFSNLFLMVVSWGGLQNFFVFYIPTFLRQLSGQAEVEHHTHLMLFLVYLKKR